MKIKLLLITLLYSVIGFGQAEFTSLTEIDNNLNNPNDITVYNDVLYVATEDQILSYDISQPNPTATTIYTVPAPTASELNVITFFNIRNGVALIAQEKIDLDNDVFVESNIVRVVLNNLSIAPLTVDTSTSYISAATFDENLLYRITESEVEGDTISTISVRDLSITNDPLETVASFTGIARDLKVFQNSLIASERDGTLFYVDPAETTPTASPLNLGTSIGNNAGIQILGNDIFITANNKIHQGFLFKQEVNLALFDLVENTTHTQEGNTTSFGDVFIHKGIIYSTLPDSGLLVKTDIEITDSLCEGTGSSIDEFFTDTTLPEQIKKVNNDLFVLERLNGISKINLTTLQKTPILIPEIVGNTFEIITDFEIVNNELFFTSITLDIDSNEFDIVSSDLKKVDVNNTTAITTLNSSSNANEVIEELEVSGDLILFSKIIENLDDTTSTQLFSFDTTNDAINQININFDFDMMLTHGSDVYFTTEDNEVLTTSISNLTNTPNLFLDTDSYINNIYIDANFLYLSMDNTLKKIALSNTNPNSDLLTVAINGSILEASEYGTSQCASFTSIALNGSTLLAAMATKIVSFNNETLSSSIITLQEKNNAFSLKNNLLRFTTKTKGVIYNMMGKQVLTFNTNVNKVVNLENLSNGLYIIKTQENQTYKIVK